MNIRGRRGSLKTDDRHGRKPERSVVMLRKKLRAARERTSVSLMCYILPNHRRPRRRGGGSLLPTLSDGCNPTGWWHFTLQRFSIWAPVTATCSHLFRSIPPYIPSPFPMCAIYALCSSRCFTATHQSLRYHINMFVAEYPKVA